MSSKCQKHKWSETTFYAVMVSVRLAICFLFKASKYSSVMQHRILFFLKVGYRDLDTKCVLPPKKGNIVDSVDHSLFFRIFPNGQ